MVLICGIPSESPLTLVNQEIQALDGQSVLLSQRSLEKTHLEWSIRNGKPQGFLHLHGASYHLEHFTGIYTRLMHQESLPGLEDQSTDFALRRHVASLHESLFQWIEIAPGRVVNRLKAMLSNSSKPYQAQLIRRFGLEIPPTLITSHPDEVLKFRKLHKKIIFKSISGTRSIVKVFSEEDEKRIELIRWCPVQFQAKIKGFDVRVHVIGEKAIATKICSQATDYRYAAQENEESNLEPFTLPAEIEKRCIRLSGALGLDFSGIDLKFSPDGKVYCFEVNSMPGYSYFEINSGQPIAKILAMYLTGLA